MNIKKQIKELIKIKGIKQVEFANRIKVDQSYISKLLSDKSDAIPSDRLIDDICKEFNVNEKWLRTGEGDIFIKTNPDNSIIDMATNALKQDKKSFQKDFLYLLSQLNEDQWSSLEDVMDIMIKNIKDNKNGDDKA